jgi:hypothetical protein
MDTQQNPNEPGKSPSPGQQGGQEQDRERERSVNVSGASRKNKVVVNRAAVSKADAKTDSVGINERREVTPAAYLSTSKRPSKGETILLC